MARQAGQDPWSAKLLRRAPQVIGDQLHFFGELQRPGTPDHKRPIVLAVEFSWGMHLLRQLINLLTRYAEYDPGSAELLAKLERMLAESTSGGSDAR